MSETEASDDSALMARVQAGDEAALGELMNRWELPVKSVIARIVLNAREAEELGQETFVRIWTQRAKYRSGAVFRPWIFAIAVNLARNRLRWWRRRPEIALEEWTESPSVGDGAATGGSTMEQAERINAVRDAIASLPTDLREAVVLFEYEQMSHAEIGDALGCTPKSVESRLYRARTKLRKALQSQKEAP